MLDISMRRSIRSFNNKIVQPELIKKILCDACYAPSSSDRQPWEFILITDKDIKREIMNIHKYAAMLQDTEYAILVCGNRSNTDDSEFWVQDCAAATQNILLSATKYNLGSVWLGVYSHRRRMEEISRILELPDNIIPFSLVVVGYSDLKPKRKVPKKKLVYENGYDSKVKFALFEEEKNELC